MITWFQNAELKGRGFEPTTCPFFSPERVFGRLLFRGGGLLGHAG